MTFFAFYDIVKKKGSDYVIIKNDIPILEFDTDKDAVLAPNHEKLPLSLPERCVFAFLGEYIYEYARAHGGKRLGEFESATKAYPVYEIEHKGERVCLCQAPVGASASAQILDWLIAYGARKIISAGSCGTLCDIDEGVFLIPYKALRDEGASYHYAPPSRFIDISERARGAIKRALSAHGICTKEVVTWSTDGFYRETRDKIAYRMDEGCEVVEMECSALASVAELRGACLGMIFYTADSLANVEKYDKRSWGGNANEYALTLCLDSVIEL